MSSAAKNEELFCEQCGTRLQTRTGQNECLQCLLQAGIESPENRSSPEEGDSRIYEHYEILTRPDGSLFELGRGAMGVTYKARDVNLDTFVALKIISADLSQKPGARRRFLEEARAAARLRHINVASVFHFGTINRLPFSLAPGTPEENAEAGECFYAMEYVEGETLEARLRRSGPLTTTIALRLGIQVARALSAAEQRGLVHRDLKPSNIMLVADEERGSPEKPGNGWVKVIDFGLAQLEDKADEPRVGFSGTVAFASPEQLQSRKVDARSDIYSLGATLWYSLTGKLPFEQRSPDDPRNSEGVGAPSTAPLLECGVPKSFAALLRSAVALNPNDRPRSAAEFSESLRNCLREVLSAKDELAYQPIRWNRRPALVGIGIAAVAVSLLAFFLSRPRAAMEEKSVAVLPFRNLSGNPANIYLADGLEEDIVSRLVRIHSLRVISYLSSSQYPATAPRDLSAIGRSLGVRFVVEGSFSRRADYISLEVTLLDTRDGHRLWNHTYTRVLADVITLQGEVARSIAQVLNVILSPQEENGVLDKSTGNPDAYALYLRGRKFDNTPGYAISDNEEAQALYRQAIALDPMFALAHARRGAALAFLYRFRGPDEDLKELAYAEVQSALRLQPELGEAHLARALCLYRIDRDFDGALAELEHARRILPNDTEAESFIAYILRRRGRWREARSALESVLARDPRNVTYAEELYTTAYLLRDWPSAAKYARLTESIDPTADILKAQRALVDVWQKGDLTALRNTFHEIKSYGGPEGTLAWMRWNAAMLDRDYNAAQEAVDSFPLDTLPSVFSVPVPKSYLNGCIALARGDKQKALSFFEIARPSMEAEAVAHPESELRHGRLGLLYAYMGRKSDAIREGQRAVELKPVWKDADAGVEQLCNLALIYARVGENTEAIQSLEKLLRTPGGVFLAEQSVSLWELRLGWEWDPLRSDPRFQKMVSGSEPATIY